MSYHFKLTRRTDGLSVYDHQEYCVAYIPTRTVGEQMEQNILEMLDKAFEAGERNRTRELRKQVLEKLGL